MNNMNPNAKIDRALGNIQRVVPVSISQQDFVDETGFFIRAATAGYIKYCPVNNADTEAITKYFDASEIFVDPEVCRKIFSTGMGSPAADDIYVGYGV